MEETFERKLLQVDLLDIYDDIASIPLSKEELIQLCSVFTCQVDLTIGNVVYAVEEKYKNKLVNYKKEKRLKWLRVNFKSIMPNPEEKFLKWQQRHNKNKQLNWMKRKMLALEFFANELVMYNSEEPCSSHSLQLATERRLSESYKENSYCRSLYNTSTESVQTVIASQPKNTLESSDYSPLIKFKNVSRSSSSSSSDNLPSPVLEREFTSLGNEAQSNEIAIRPPIKVLERSKRRILPLLQESEGISSQEEAYVTFYQDMQVTSTQEFG